MSVALSIDLSENVSRALDGLQLGLRAERLHPVLGRAGVNLLRDHFFALDRARPNQLGGRRTHFYAQAARGTHFQSQPDAVVLSVNQVGIRQRLLGGIIRPGPGKTFLTIPARAEAHGRRAREFNDLEFVVIPGVGPALVEARRTEVRIGRRRKDGSRRVTALGERGGGVMYWLKRFVVQEPDPTVLPSQLDLAAAMLSALNRHVDGLASGGAR
jgi:hypothetical protein